MKLSVFALSATAAFVLSACGNGGTYQPTTAAQPTLKPSVPPPTQTANNNAASGSPEANHQNGKQPDTAANTAAPSATGGNVSGSLATNKQDGKKDDKTEEPKAQTTPGVDIYTTAIPAYAPGNECVFCAAKYNGATGKLSPGMTLKFDDENKPEPANTKISLKYFDMNNSDLSKLVLFKDDKGVSLKPEAKGRKITIGSSDKQSDTYAEVGKDLNYAVYGVFERYPHKDMRKDSGFAFVQGKAGRPEDVPTAGTAEYRGSALYRSDNLLEATAAADARFTVDFGNKKLNGDIVDAGAGKNFKLEADIDGNRFDSKSGAKVLTYGNFYGANAEELAGVFRDNSDENKTYGGAFGATRQDK